MRLRLGNSLLGISLHLHFWVVEYDRPSLNPFHFSEKICSCYSVIKWLWLLAGSKHIMEYGCSRPSTWSAIQDYLSSQRINPFTATGTHVPKYFQQVACIDFHGYTSNFLLISLTLKNIWYFIDHILVNIVERLFSKTEQTETKLSGSESVNGTQFVTIWFIVAAGFKKFILSSPCSYHTDSSTNTYTNPSEWHSDW